MKCSETIFVILNNYFTNNFARTIDKFVKLSKRVINSTRVTTANCYELIQVREVNRVPPVAREVTAGAGRKLTLRTVRRSGRLARFLRRKWTERAKTYER